MNLFQPILILGFAFFVVFAEATLTGPRDWLGAQIDLLPALMVYAALNADIITLSLLAVLGGLWFDSLSANPLGITILPLFLAGFPIYFRRELILRTAPFAQLVLGAAASAAVPTMVLLLMLNLGWQPMVGWDTLWQIAVVTAGGAAATPLLFGLLDWCGGALGYKEEPEMGFRPDREIRHGRLLK